MENLRTKIKLWEKEFVEEFGRKPQKGDIDGRREIAALYRAYAVQKEKEKAKETGKRRNYYRGYDPKSSIEVAIPQGSSVVQNPEPEGNIQTAGNEQMKLEFSPEKVEKERGFSSENAEIKQRINASEVELKPELGDCASLKSSEAPKVNFDSKSALESKDESMEHVGKNSSSSGIKKTKTQKRPNANVNESQGSSKKAKSSSDNSTKARKKKLSQATENYVKLNIRQKNFSCAHKIRKPVQSGLVRRKWLSKKEYFHQKRSFELKEINQTLYNELDDSLLHTIFEGTQTLQDDTVPEPKSHLSSAEQVLREIFGFQDFRPGQREVIDNLMNQQSSLLVLPTGQGKSLCYQIPAFLLNGLTLVITPLISLMQDQLKRLPKELSGAYWNSQMTSQESSLFFSDLLSGKFKILFVSPERLFTSGFAQVIAKLPSPGISLACIDEVHCVSEWSHNFRPCYIRIHKVLKELNIPCILGLTATATARTEDQVCRVLNIPKGNCIRQNNSRENLILTVSREHDRLNALLDLLNSQDYKNLDSIIVYVSRQQFADDISNLLNQRGFLSESYHAGKSFSERHRVQSNFMSKVTRIIVATIAFGMGIDKADVRSVIHYNCPRTLEQYVQEIGRAGRDGELARCHMFFNDEDVVRHRSLVFSDGVEKSQIMSILRSIFSTRDGVSDGQRIYHCLKIERIEKFLDMRSPVIETILVGLERQSPSEVKICPNVHAECALSFHKSDVDVLSSQSLVIENIINKSRCRLGKYYVQLDHIANEMQISIQELQKELIALKKNGEVSLEWRNWSYCIETRAQADDLERLCSDIHEEFRKHECIQLEKVCIAGQIFKAVACDFVKQCNPSSTSEYLHLIVSQYFDGVDEATILSRVETKLPNYERLEYINAKENMPSFLESDIKVFILTNLSKGLSNGRQVARIFHGIQSPRFSAKNWSKNPMWGRHIYYPFDMIRQIAQESMDDISQQSLACIPDE